jgi:hypothetical protein
LAIVLSILSSSTFSFGNCVVCSFLLFPLVIVLSVLFYFFFWPLCCLFFSTFSFRHCVDKKKSRKEQTTQWQKEKVEKNRQHNDQEKK